MSQRLSPPGAQRARQMPPAPSTRTATPRVPAWRLPSWAVSLLLLSEWAFLLAALGLWVASRTYSVWMNAGGLLLIGSWVARWVRTGQVIRPTPIDFPLVLFLLSAVVACWIAPDRAAALVRLYLFLGAAALYYLLVNSEAEPLALFSNVLLLVVGALGLYFASQHNWAGQPAKFAAVGSLGLRLNQWVPDLGLYQPHPNVVAGILALTAPIAVARTAAGIRRSLVSGAQTTAGRLAAWPNWPTAIRLALAAFSGLATIAIIFGLVMTESRTSWLALLGAGALAAWWWVAGRIERRGARSQAAGRIFWAGLGITVVVGIVGVILRPPLLTIAFGALPGLASPSAIGRMDIYGQVWRLAQDTPFTGGGLDAFPALYSTYILDIPYLFLTHAHNAYLNVLVEQGWPGLIGYASLLAVACWAAARRAYAGRSDDSANGLVAAGALGLAVVVLHGLGDGTLVASRATPALLLPAGLALAGPATTDAPQRSGRPAISSPLRRLGLGVAFPALLAAALVMKRSWLGAWHANLGVVTYDRIELAGWPRPTGQWDDGSRTPLYARAEPDLRKALVLQPSNRTAHHRLGLAAAVRRDFREAAAHLERAHQADMGHRGVIKALGYTYVWLGEYERAAPLLAAIPEARGELEVFTWWWGTQGRGDLAGHAQTMLARLGQ